MTSQPNQPNQGQPQLPGGDATHLIPSDGSAKNKQQFNARALRDGLKHVAYTLHESGRGDVLLVGIGKGIRVLNGVQITTDKLDVLGSCFRNESRKEFEAAAKLAAQASQGALPQNWAITKTQDNVPIRFSPELHQTITEEALLQNDKVVEERGLIVYAAPWEYELLRAVAQLEQGKKRLRLLDEAVYYLHRYVTKYPRAADWRVTTKDIEGWKQKYKCDFSPNYLINIIGDAYFQHHLHNPFQG